MTAAQYIWTITCFNREAKHLRGLAMRYACEGHPYGHLQTAAARYERAVKYLHQRIGR